MRIPLKWLRDYVDFSVGADDLAELVTNAGLEVTKIDRLGVEGAALVWERDKVLAAQILEVNRHPDADRLVLAKVRFGADEPKVVVTGAPNLFEFLDRGELSAEGLYSPLLLEGGLYLDAHKEGKPTRLKGKSLRGVYNDAMLCSEVELGLGDDADGILLLRAADLGPLAPDSDLAGLPLQDILGDVVLEIDIIPNVARCASMVGVAREVAALTLTEFRLPNFSIVADGDPLGERVRISSNSPELNPRFVAILAENVEQGPAPFWMRHRLQLAGQRPIGVVVDVSNYVMLEIGQPNHSFDFDFLSERASRYDDSGQVHIITRQAQDGETLTTLDGEERKLRSNNVLVTDPEGPLSLAGVMGGAESEIRPETTRVLIEAAAWNFLNIRQTARQHQLLSDAAFRFSRGVHPSQALPGALRTAELLRLYAGATVAEGLVDHYPQPAPTVTIALDGAYVRRLSGLDIPASEMKSLLERLEFGVTEDGDRLSVTAPDHRLDIDGPHDLVEEICRLYGYDRIPSTVLADSLPTQRGNLKLEQEERIKDLLVEEGLSEVLTYRLTTEAALARVGEEPSPEDSYVRLLNPSTVDRVVLRQSLLASVLEVAASNSRFQSDIRVFEIGSTYQKIPGEALPHTHDQLAIVMSGPQSPAHWQTASPLPLDFYDLKGTVESLASALEVAVRFDAAESPTFRPGVCAAMLADDGEQLALLGELHPCLVDGNGFRLEEGYSVFAALLDLEALRPRLVDRRTIESASTYPAIREDLALVVNRDIPAAKVESLLRQAAGPLLTKVELFDLYEGDNVDENQKSLAYHLTYHSRDKTLRDKDAQKARRRILGRLEKEIGARLR